MSRTVSILGETLNTIFSTAVSFIVDMGFFFGLTFRKI